MANSRSCVALDTTPTQMTPMSDVLFRGLPRYNLSGAWGLHCWSGRQSTKGGHIRPDELCCCYNMDVVFVWYDAMHGVTVATLKRAVVTTRKELHIQQTAGREADQSQLCLQTAACEA